MDSWNLGFLEAPDSLGQAMIPAFCGVVPLRWIRTQETTDSFSVDRPSPQPGCKRSSRTDVALPDQPVRLSGSIFDNLIGRSLAQRADLIREIL